VTVLRYTTPESLGLSPEHELSQGDVIVGVTPEIVSLLRTVIENVTAGRPVTLLASAELLTTTQAANALEISRPTLSRLLDENVLPSIAVGAHRQVRVDAVAAYQLLREARLSSVEFDNAVAAMRGAGVRDSDFDTVTDEGVSDEAAEIATDALAKAFAAAATR